jgi:hypothetical protein
MVISREEFEKKKRFMRRLLNAFMVLCLMLPLAGIAALLSGFAEPGDGEGSMTSAQACFVFAGIALLVLVFWKLLLVALNWIATRQATMLFDRR